MTRFDEEREEREERIIQRAQFVRQELESLADTTKGFNKAIAKVIENSLEKIQFSCFVDEQSRVDLLKEHENFISDVRAKVYEDIFKSTIPKLLELAKKSSAIL